ncbi:AAA family ATPase [Staphylococcus epidermidis]|nr:AAA family ATPase [Staphylococcus epidermidis]
MELDFQLVGILAIEEETKKLNERLEPIKLINDQDLKFFLKILNEDDIPSNYRKYFQTGLVTAYDNQLDSKEYDELKKGRLLHESSKVFQKFSEDKVFIFKPYFNENGLEININVAHNTLKIFDKPKSLTSRNSNSLITLPIFKDYNQFEFEKRLLNNESIGKVKNMKHLPSAIICGDYMYGEIENSQLLNDGFHIDNRNTLKRIAIDFEKYKSHCIKHNNFIYIDFGIFEELFIKNGLLHYGENIVLNNNIMVKEMESKNNINEEDGRYSEADFLKKLKNILSKQGYFYSDNQLINLHTSLKTGRLVILNGPSGTGKTNLVLQYAKALGLMKEEFNQFKLISVKPNWKDDSELIGFLDTINNIYRPSENGLLDTLIEANKYKDKLYIICFDEMNLATIEHYFSQFLSILEMESADRKLRLYSKKLIGRIFNADYYPHEIKIGENVLFVGTINNDETTETISDKVLDRCNFIDLNLPENHIERWIAVKEDLKNENRETELKKDTLTVTYENFVGWKNTSKVINLSEDEIFLLEEINNILKEINLEISFRSLNHIDSYLKNLPKDSILTRKEALDFQIAQKILPKIRGTQMELSSIIDDESGLTSIIDEKNYPKSFKIIDQKSKELKVNGFTY